MFTPRWQPAALVLLTLAASAAGAPAPAPPANPPPPGMMVFAEELARPVKFSGFDADPKMTRQEALDAIQLLATALQTLAERSGISIVLDSRAAEQGRIPVTASLANVPVDTAVKILADMAGLDSVLLDNVCYVTTRENANRLRAEQERNHSRGRYAPAEAEKEPAPTPEAAPKDEGPPPARGTAKGAGSRAPGTDRH